ncbi:Hint domain-containing protein, partial [Acidocella sp.]|uniref:Hint domain-containing protein n=1 Tax=Acidocella sp. TaxID=50710 RepID=UPI0026325E68
DYGATLALDNPTGNDAGQTVTFGTHGSTTAPNTLLINDNSSGFGGTVTGFGVNDAIILGASTLPALPANDGVALSYSGTGDVLTISETNASGGVVSSSTVTVIGTAALSTGSFVAEISTLGIVVESAAGLAGHGFTFAAGAGNTASFESPTPFGGTAPGDIIATGETVTISTGTASVSSGGVTDNGTISVLSGAGFTDAHSLTGTGTLAVAAGGSASLTGNTTLGTITDAGTLTLGGTDAVAINITGAASIASAFSDSQAITGAGALTIGSGITATLAAGSSIASVLDNGTLNLAGAMGGSINMEGNGTHTVADFNTANAAAKLINFGTTDAIILANGALATPVAGDGLVLNYSTAGVLTVTETNASGTSIASDAVTVAGVTGLSTGSFIALESAAGTMIELAPTTATAYNFSASGTGSFEAYANYTGGVAPGDILTTNESVTISAGTASVSSGGVADNGTISVLSGAGFTDAHSLTGTGTLAVAAGGAASLTGNTTLGTITDAGTLALGGTDAVAINIAGAASIASTFSDSQAITGTGALTIGSGITATLAAGSSVASVLDNGTLNLAGAMGGSINMEGNNANTVADFLGSDVTGNTLNTSFTNLGFGDKIILGGANFALSGSADVLTESYSGGVLTVTDTTSHATVAVNVSLTAGDAASLIHVTDNTGALVITLCFYPGTALATPEGTILVEDIKPGDMLMTANGAKPVRWIGQSHIHTRFADPLRSLPIRIRQGALGDGLPQRDLLLSPDHAIHVDGILVQASALVNGSSIIRDYDVPESFTYYHVELDSHELLLAEGVDAESFVDNVDRMHFHNWEDRMAPEAAIMEMDLPRAKSARQVPASIRRRLGLDQMAVA